MLKRKYRWKKLNILEVHYLEKGGEFKRKSELEDIDVIKFYQSENNYQDKLDPFHTLHIDLTKDSEDIFKNFHSNTRNEIRKNIKSDNVTYHYIINPERNRLIDFMKNLEKFMHQKDNSIDYDFLLKQAIDFQKNIYLTYVQKEGKILAEHLYLYDEKRVRYKSGISYRFDNHLDAKIVGRSNRGLHWHDIQMFKEKGFVIYDFGGIAYETEDKAKININKFKERFTKNLVTEFQGNVAVSYKGRLALTFHALLQKIRK